MSNFILYLWLIFGAALFVQLVFIVFYFNKIHLRKAEPTPSKLPPISIVCCARNETENLRKLIPALLAQKYAAPFEIILVDDRSDDEMYDYLLELQRDEKLVRLVRIEHTPDHINFKKFALTMGIKAAKYENILLTDADCEPASEHWIRQMASNISPEKEIVLGYSLYKPYGGLLNALIRYETFVTCVQYLSLALGGNPYMGVGRSLSYTKTIFLKNKGFHEHLGITGGDDDLFINRVATAKNTATCTNAEALMWSEPKRTFEQWYRQKLRHLGAGKYYSWRDKWWLALQAFSQIGVWGAGIALCFTEPPMAYIAAGGLFLRIALLTWTLHKNAKTLGETLPWYSFPLLDFLQILYPPFFALPALVLKRRSWN